MRPINKLPPEILSSIAREVLHWDHSDTTKLLPLTHVCRRWRESLISIPENWALISNENEGIAVICLQRAKAAPLEITIYMPSPTGPFLFPRILEPHVQKTRTLSVTSISTIEQLMGMFPNFPQSMPTLESLDLTSYELEGDWSIDRFGPFTPTLRRLSLYGIPLYPSLLRVRTLTQLTLSNLESPPSLDTLLDFLEGNQSLKSANLWFSFAELPRRNPQRRILNQLQHLWIECRRQVDARALITSIPLRRGAHLKIKIPDESAALSNILPNVSTAHLSNPPSPTFFQFDTHEYNVGILLRGPGGEFSFCRPPRADESFPDYHLLPLTNVREFRLVCSGSTAPDPPTFRPPLFPSLEALAIIGNDLECNVDVRRVLSSLLLNPTSSPLLKNLAFLNCDLSDELMEEITKFSSERKKTLTSTWLYRVLIIHRDGKFPSAASIEKLREHVSVVDVSMKHTLPEDLT